MFDSKQEISEAVDALYAVTMGLNRGDILTHEQVQEVLGLSPHEGPWDHIVYRTLKRLENERGIAYWSSKNIGYKLLTKAEQFKVSSWRLKKGMRQIRRGRKSTAALPEKELTLNERRAKHFLVDGLREMEQSARRKLRDQEEVRRPTPVLPRRPVVALKAVENGVHDRDC
jgi:hypothetical protein